MRSNVFKIGLVFCQVVFAIGFFIIPLAMTFNPENKLLINVWVLCVFGWLGAITMYQAEKDYEEQLAELNELEFAEIEEDTLICGQCGSDNISQMAKVNPNTLELDEFVEECLFDEPYYCNNEDCLVETFDEATSYHKGEA